MTISTLACSGEPPAELVVDGSARVLVEEIGRVQLPPILTADGVAVEELRFEVADSSVIEVRDGGLNALRAGQSAVIVRAASASTTLQIVVDPPMRLSFEPTPVRMQVGDTTRLKIHGHRGNEELEPGKLTWISSHAEVISVDDQGTAMGVGSGVAWITAEAHGGTAMIELTVE